jgi:hypothetical protein
MVEIVSYLNNFRSWGLLKLRVFQLTKTFFGEMFSRYPSNVCVRASGNNNVVEVRRCTYRNNFLGIIQFIQTGGILRTANVAIRLPQFYIL